MNINYKTAYENVMIANKMLENENMKLKKTIDKAIEYIKENCVLSDEWKELDFCNFVPIGKITYNSLSPKKVRKLLDILKGNK